MYMHAHTYMHMYIYLGEQMSSGTKFTHLINGIGVSSIVMAL
jgi:hypothetical protein